MPMTEHSDEGLNVLLVSDPGLPTRRVNSVKGTVESNLHEIFSPPVQVYSVTQMIGIRPDHTLDIDSVRRIADDYERVDVIMLLTEIPRHSEGKPLVAELYPDYNVAVVSCPTLGAWLTKSRLTKLFTACAIRLSPTRDIKDSTEYELAWSNWSHRDSDGGYALHSSTLIGGLRTVLGMTIANDPWRTAPKLSSALAAASATGAFGIFYNSIWEMADYLSTSRLLIIGVLAMAAMVAWLIISNRLWDKPKQERLSTVVTLYNLSTVMTLFLCVLSLYLVLALLILVSGMIVIAPDFMSQILGREAQFSNYLDIAWLSAAMGVVAGALGSSFDSSMDLRQITHGQRERQRQYTEDQERKQQEEDGLEGSEETSAETSEDATGEEDADVGAPSHVNGEPEADISPVPDEAGSTNGRPSERRADVG